MILIASKEEKELLHRLRKMDGSLKLASELAELKTKIAEAKIEREQINERHDREERELRHMIGLEKKRQEFEIKQAREETSLSIREGNLSAEKKRFDENLKFNTDRFEKMETYLKDMMKSILERLPNVNMEIAKNLKK